MSSSDPTASPSGSPTGAPSGSPTGSPSGSPSPSATPTQASRHDLSTPSPSEAPERPPAPSTAPSSTIDDDSGSEVQALRHDTAPTLATYTCDVVVVGGTTAALAAAQAAVEMGAQVVLVEPTNWAGGQLTASAVSAVDWANTRHYGSPMFDIAINLDNQTRSFADLVSGYTKLNSGLATVGPTEFMPQAMASKIDAKVIAPLEKTGRFKILRETVISKVDPGGGAKIKSLTVLRAKSRRAYGWLSEELPDWYDPKKTEICTIKGRPERGGSTKGGATADKDIVVIDATEWGEVLVLAGAAYTVGAEAQEGVSSSCMHSGQAIVFDFVEELMPAPVEEKALDVKGVPPEGYYGLGTATQKDYDYALVQKATGISDPEEIRWHLVWWYRRLSAPRGIKPFAQVQDMTLQNWKPGNDDPRGYLFLDEAAVAKQVTGNVGDWQGGVDRDVLRNAEACAIGWHKFFKAKNKRLGPQVRIAPVLGTMYGLAKVPYIRDTRRSIGIGGFRFTSDQMLINELGFTGPKPTPPDIAVAIGNYKYDMHLCTELDRIVARAGAAGDPSADFAYLNREGKPQPGLFYIPFRALTNDTVPNLLVAGKTMAQSFLANAATRLHPIEWATGTAAGVVAAKMASWGVYSTKDIYADTTYLTKIHEDVSKRTPTEWQHLPTLVTPGPHIA